MSIDSLSTVTSSILREVAPPPTDSFKWDSLSPQRPPPSPQRPASRGSISSAPSRAARSAEHRSRTSTPLPSSTSRPTSPEHQHRHHQGVGGVGGGEPHPPPYHHQHHYGFGDPNNDLSAADGARSVTNTLDPRMSRARAGHRSLSGFSSASGGGGGVPADPPFSRSLEASQRARQALKGQGRGADRGERGNHASQSDRPGTPAIGAAAHNRTGAHLMHSLRGAPLREEELPVAFRVSDAPYAKSISDLEQPHKAAGAAPENRHGSAGGSVAGGSGVGSGPLKLLAKTSVGSRPAKAMGPGFAALDASQGVLSEEAHLQTAPAHYVRLSPIGKSYVQYQVRGRPYVSRLAECVPSRAEVAALRAQAAAAEGLRAQLGVCKGQLEAYSAEAAETERRRALGREHASSAKHAARLAMDHEDLASLCTDFEKKLMELRFKVMLLSGLKGSGDGAEAQLAQQLASLEAKLQASEAKAAALAAAQAEGCQGCGQLRELLSEVKLDTQDLKDELRAALERAVASERALGREKKRCGDLANSLDGGPKTPTAEAATQYEEQGDGAEEAAAAEALSLEEQLLRSKRLCPLGKFVSGKLALKKGSKPKLTPDALLDILNDVYEKKVVSDCVDKRMGHQPDPFTEFLDGYFLNRFGLQKMATKKLAEFIHALLAHQNAHRRITPFLFICGLVDQRLFCRAYADVVVNVMIRVFGTYGQGERYPKPEKLKGVYDKLRATSTMIPLASVPHALLGHGRKLSDPATLWECPELRKVATVKQIRALVVSAMTTLRVTEAAKSVTKVIDLDDLLALVLKQMQAWYRSAQAKLEAFFIQNDLDESGCLEYEEFATTLRLNLGEGALMDADPRHVLRQWKEMVSKAGNRANEDTGVPMIASPELFAIAACQCDLLPPPAADDDTKDGHASDDETLESMPEA